MRRLVLLVACLALAQHTLASAAGQRKPTRDVSSLVARVGDYVAEYLSRAQSIIADEAVRIQSIRSDMMSDGSPQRVVRNELRLLWEPGADGAPGTPQVLRTLLTVNGRPPRPKDEDKCFDPKATTPETLSLFLPESRDELTFSYAGEGKSGGRRAAMVDLRERVKGTPTPTQEGTCHSLTLPGRTWWRVWVDEATGTVLRLDQHLTGIVDWTIPADPVHHTPQYSTLLERLDVSITYKRVAFKDPDEFLMLPASKETVQMLRGGPFSPGIRITQEYRNYRRFMTGIRIVQ